MTTKDKKAIAIANNDIIYLWWKLPKKIKNCLGFTIHRIIEDSEEKTGLYATVGFDVVKDKRKSPQTTDEWPIQSFNWKDVYAPHDKSIQYKITPMIGSWENLKPDTANFLITDPVKRTQEYGNIKVIFNRGILSTQAFSKSGTGKKVTADAARKMITNPTSEWRKRLGGQMLYNVKEFFGRADKNGGKYYAALYELTDKTLIEHLTQNKGTEILLSNANGSKKVKVDGETKTVTVNDKTNKDTRKALHKLMKQGRLKVYDRMLGSHIGHNKFVIYVDKDDKPQVILTGSTNWTPTGLCGQTNNMVIIESPELAEHYMEYWENLKNDIPVKQGKELRTWCFDNSFTETVGQNSGDVQLWYSPNTKQKTNKKDSATPIDIEDLYGFIEQAKTALFLVFNPGGNSIINKIKEVGANRSKSNPLFVRGAVSDAALAKKVTTNIFSGDMRKKPDTYFFERITGVAAIPGPFSYWEDELLKIGFATIHDKILVLDPFDSNCIVVTGSHNLGYAASYKNDENMLIIRNNRSLAEAYATHVLDVVNHFKWRYRLQDKITKAKAKTLKQKEAVLKKEWHDLDETDSWKDQYFNNAGFINREKFIL